METHEGKPGHWPDLLEKIRDVGFAMLTTENKDGTLHSRPMTTLDVSEAGVLWFFTGRSSLKAREVELHSRVNLAYVSEERGMFVSVAGVGRLVADRSKAEQLWQPGMEIWFPQGLEDPDLVLLKVEVVSVEYWDVASKKRSTLFTFSEYADILSRLVP
ncbi:MAG: pyridoxamine 5'-phosphate oxidase family protein [Fibrobacterota bacterium]|nr:pyridoxamine 5'-phosphate oxidase family protein [Fibrobacterota bacterium]